MISVLIPTYNFDVTALVGNLLNQFKNLEIAFEIRVQDDCSTEIETESVNKTIENIPNCFYAKNLVNQGRTATRQILAEDAQYNWLLFMDADVLPKNDDFIKNLDLTNLAVDVVYGGITYKDSRPENEKILRWKYGRAREAKTVLQREKLPHLSIISQCILIKKMVFLKANDFHDKVYGVDVLFAHNLEKMNAQVLHNENPIIHLGLESNAHFIEKSKKALQSINMFEKQLKIPNNYRPIQKAYLRLKHSYLLGGFIVMMQFLDNIILKNLMSSNPSLFLFDLYRLYYFAHIKQT